MYNDCSDGANRTGVYLTLAVCIERVEVEDNVDIYQTLRWLRTQRAGLVGNAVSIPSNLGEQ